MGQLKILNYNCNTTKVGNEQSMLVLMVLGKINYTRLKFCQEGVTVFLKDSELLKSKS